MPINDWTLVEAGIFHSFHTTWIAQINTALNEGLLPPGFYSLAEQHAGETIADILTLHDGAGVEHRPACPLPRKEYCLPRRHRVCGGRKLSVPAS